MEEIKYTNHLRLRLGIRRIHSEYPRIIYASPEQMFFDNVEKTNIAIKRLKYRHSRFLVTESTGMSIFEKV